MGDMSIFYPALEAYYAGRRWWLTTSSSSSLLSDNALMQYLNSKIIEATDDPFEESDLDISSFLLTE